MPEKPYERRRSGLVIRSSIKFREHFSDLGPGDYVVGQLNLKKCEETVFVDLVERGIRLMPPALSQQLSRSKCLQALIYSQYMPEGTTVVRCRHDLVKTIEHYGRLDARTVITKQDRLDCGLGVNLWNGIEEVFNACSFGNLDFPFVIQPFIKGARDIRVILLGNYYMEAYWRENPWSFRNNLHFGGKSGPLTLSAEQEEMCRKIAERGKFPYAHIDLLLAPDGCCFMSEISLRGGIRGAAISPAAYREIIQRIHEDFLNTNAS